MTNAVNVASLGTSVSADSSGNVGIGTATPAAVTGFTTNRNVLQVTSSSAYGQIRVGGVSGFMIDHNDASSTVTTFRNLYGASDAAALTQIQSGYLTFGTGTSYTERMRISANGYVTMPYQPAFGVTGTGYNPNGVVNELLYPNILSNVGSHYSASTGRFTAPVAGRYYFVASNDTTGANNVGVRMKKNGTQVAASWCATSDGACSCVVILELGVGDYISVGTDIGMEGGLSQFCGHLIG